MLAAGLFFAAWPVALLAFAFPLAAFLALFTRGPRRVAAGLLAVAVPALLGLGVPEYRFFVAGAVLTTAALGVALRATRRVGYGEASVCALAGLALAALAWGGLDPGFFGRLRDGLEAAALTQGRAWTEWLTRAGGDAQTRLLVEQAVETSAVWSARSWPAAFFLALWTGSAAGLALAAHRARAAGGAAKRVAVGERCARFRLPDAWLWALLTGVAAYLLTPQAAGTPPAAGAAAVAHEAALNLALVAAGLYAWQGLAVTLYFLERRGIRAAGRVFFLASGLVLLTLPVLVLALGLGLADAWLDLRARGRKGTPAPPEDAA
ncbi:MAG: DUF2232 domain-containing protein [Gemmatimonadota bacterium]